MARCLYCGDATTDDERALGRSAISITGNRPPNPIQMERISRFISYFLASVGIWLSLATVVNNWTKWQFPTRRFLPLAIASCVLCGLVGVLTLPGHSDVSKVVDHIVSLPHKTESQRGEKVVCEELFAEILRSGSLAMGEEPAISPAARSLADEIGTSASPYGLGMKAMGEGRYDDARRLFEVARSQPDADPIKLTKARAELETLAGNPGTTVVLLQQALQIQPTDAQLRWGLAKALSGVGRYEEAGAAFEHAAADAPDDNLRSSVRLSQGIMYLNSGNDAKALDVLDTAMQLHIRVWGHYHPGNREIYLAQSMANTGLRRYVEAGRLARLALEVNDGYGLQGANLSLAHMHLAISLSEQGQHNEARNEFGVALHEAEGIRPERPSLIVTVLCNESQGYAREAEDSSGGEVLRAYGEAEEVAKRGLSICDINANIQDAKTMCMLSVYIFILKETDRDSEAVVLEQRLARLQNGPPLVSPPTPDFGRSH